MIRPEDFGAAGDGTTDDTRALQQAFDKAEGASLILTRRYRTSATLLLPSSTSLQGVGAAILGRAEDGPIIASKAWATRAPTRGRTRIAGLRIEGTGRGARQDGVVLFDFWSELADLEIVNTGGRGIVLTAADRNRMAATGGTLVENRVRRCIVRGSAGTPFFLGEPANNKLTDGDLTDCIGVARDGADGPIVSLGHAAGWTVRNLHTYGGRPRTAIEVRQAYFTRIADLYCEGFTETGLALPDIQTQVSVTNAQIVAIEPLDAGAAFLSMSGHRDFTQPAADFVNVGLSNLSQSPAAALRNLDNRVAVGGTPLRIDGPGAALVAGGSGPSPGGAPGGLAPREPDGRRTLTWTGRDARMLEVASRAVGDAFAEAFLLTLTGRSPDGTLTTQFAGMLHWTRAQPEARAVLVDLVLFGPPTGFQRPPSATFERRGDRLVLTLSFTPVASGPGQLTIS